MSVADKLRDKDDELSFIGNVSAPFHQRSFVLLNLFGITPRLYLDIYYTPVDVNVYIHRQLIVFSTKYGVRKDTLAQGIKYLY